MQSNAQAAARLASQAANLKLRSTRSPARQQLRQQLGQASQRGGVDCGEVQPPMAVAAGARRLGEIGHR
jgi:hypothetical protein